MDVVLFSGAIVIAATFGSVFGFYLAGFYGKKLDERIKACRERNSELEERIKTILSQPEKVQYRNELAENKKGS